MMNSIYSRKFGQYGFKTTDLSYLTNGSWVVSIDKNTWLEINNLDVTLVSENRVLREKKMNMKDVLRYLRFISQYDDESLQKKIAKFEENSSRSKNLKKMSGEEEYSFFLTLNIDGEQMPVDLTSLRKLSEGLGFSSERQIIEKIGSKIRQKLDCDSLELQLVTQKLISDQKQVEVIFSISTQEDLYKDISFSEDFGNDVVLTLSTNEWFTDESGESEEGLLS